MFSSDLATMAASTVGRQAVPDALAALTEQVENNSASMDVFFILVSGYLVFLMQTVRALAGRTRADHPVQGAREWRHRRLHGVCTYLSSRET